MAICSFIKERKQMAGNMRWIIQYVFQPKRTMDEEGNRYLTGINCVADVAMQSFIATKCLYGKDTGTFFYQHIQSFSPEEDLTPAQAHQIGLKLAEQFFPSCEVLVAMHVDRQHLHSHSHLVVNSVRPDTGKKPHLTPRMLEEMRKVSDQICMEHGSTTLKPYRQDHRTKGLGAGEYRAAMRGESWKFQLITMVEAVMKVAGSREEFVQEMKGQGYQIRWEEYRKCITYTTPTGMKCRDDRLHELRFRKENMEHEFGVRTQAAQQCFDSPQVAGSTSHPDGTTGQYAVYDAGADGGAVGECPPAYPGPSGDDPGIRGHSGHEGGPGAAGHLRTVPTVAGVDAGPQPGNLPVNGAHTLRHERNNQTEWEAERRIHQRVLSHWVGLSEEHPGDDLFAPEMDPLHHHEFGNGGGAGVYFRVANADITTGVLRLLSRLEGDPDDFVLDATIRHGHGDRRALAREQQERVVLGHEPDDHDQGQ